MKLPFYILRCLLFYKTLHDPQSNLGKFQSDRKPKLQRLHRYNLGMDKELQIFHMYKQLKYL